MDSEAHTGALYGKLRERLLNAEMLAGQNQSADVCASGEERHVFFSRHQEANVEMDQTGPSAWGMRLCSFLEGVFLELEF